MLPSGEDKDHRVTKNSFICDPQVRAVGKPLLGRAIGALAGAAVGCAASGKRCSPGKTMITGAAVAALGYLAGAAWDKACSR